MKAGKRSTKNNLAKVLTTALLTMTGTGMGMTIFASTGGFTTSAEHPTVLRRPATNAPEPISGRSTSNLDMLYLSDFVYANWDNYIGHTFAQLSALPTSSNPFLSNTSMMTVEDNLPMGSALSDLRSWKAIDYSDYVSSSGFYGVAYQNTITKEIVVAFRGSSNAGDYVYDLNTIALHIPLGGSDQLSEARHLVTKVINQHPNAKILLSGHSLGGWLAERISLDLYEHKLHTTQPYQFLGAATFNAPGFQQGQYLSKREWTNNEAGVYDHLITNFVIQGDIIGSWETPIGAPRIYLKCWTLRGADTVNPFTTHPLYNFFYTSYFEQREAAMNTVPWSPPSIGATQWQKTTT